MSKYDKFRTCIKCSQLKALKNSRAYVESWLCNDCYTELAEEKKKGPSSSSTK